MEGLGRDRPSWLEGLAHLWLPYAQMKTAPPPLAVARTEGRLRTVRTEIAIR